METELLILVKTVMIITPQMETVVAPTVLMSLIFLVSDSLENLTYHLAHDEDSTFLPGQLEDEDFK